ncbi:hypothetical protein SJI00_08650 [Pseudomonas sp. RP23018S]|uniref:hypothetical protein n=1 Tax=Pseudomonas sp. RP23018S TaxID=3096037 RepID=UPI002ACA099F|nr:hypothetical protein [Pseudomonas sp. RP23018S]MDZ5602842.1 hypothetical protein [Pseudomonas sp. RP23018S]
MNKLYDALRGLLGQQPEATAEPDPVIADPNAVLFSLPTLADDAAPVEPLTDAPPCHGLVLHEDDWRQLEFLPHGQLADIQRLLSEFKPFEAAQREAYGWQQTYLRVLAPSTVIAGPSAEAELAEALGATLQPAPLICTSQTVLGCVTAGFGLALGEHVTLYGYTDAHGICVLGVSLGEQAEHQRLVQAFYTLNARYGLVLVDWCQQRVVTGQREEGGLALWQA